MDETTPPEASPDERHLARGMLAYLMWDKELSRGELASSTPTLRYVFWLLTKPEKEPAPDQLYVNVAAYAAGQVRQELISRGESCPEVRRWE